jgi:hypothetical protein
MCECAKAASAGPKTSKNPPPNPHIPTKGMCRDEGCDRAVPKRWPNKSDRLCNGFSTLPAGVLDPAIVELDCRLKEARKLASKKAHEQQKAEKKTRRKGGAGPQHNRACLGSSVCSGFSGDQNLLKSFS